MPESGTIEREPQIIDNLTSTSTIDSLSANQGKVLNEKIPPVEDNLTSTSTTSALSANQGKVLNEKIPPVVDNLTSTSATSSLSANQGRVLNGSIKTKEATWTLLGSTTGQNVLTYPSTAVELAIYVYDGSHAFSNILVVSELGSTTNLVRYVGGYYSTASDYGFCNLNINSSGRKISIRNCVYGGSVRTTTATIKIYYKTNALT